MNRAQFIVSDACIGCGRCVNVCPGGILHMGADGKPCIQDFDEFGWNGCWKCQHCLAVCPKAAVSVLGRHPEDSIPMPDPVTAEPVMDALVAGRRSCRRYLHRNVPRETIDEMLKLLANAPNGGNKQLVEYTLVDSTETMDRLRTLARTEMERLADGGIYPEGYDEQSYDDLKRWEKTVRPDMLFCGAPHILIPPRPAWPRRARARRHHRGDVLRAALRLARARCRHDDLSLGRSRAHAGRPRAPRDS